MYIDTKRHKKHSSNGKPLNINSYILIFKKLGFTVADLEFFDIGDILDVAIEAVKDDKDEETERQATQDDINRFFKS